VRLIVNLLLPFALFCSLSFTDVDKQYPEDRDYGAEDRGMGRYAAKSLYQTGKFALTFDDGPSPVNTPKLLDILKEGNVHATFFVMTEHMTEANLPLLKRVLDEGHILASHGLGHIHSNQLDAAAFKKNLKDSFLRLKQVYAYSGHNMDSIY
jgi:peptidoglycan/xylan/chitin deacetylase (PgdA/CDA1 family)